MIPLRDVQRTRRFPLVVVALIGANTLVYLYQLSLGAGVEHFFGQYALIPAKFWSLSTYSRDGIVAALLPLFTSMFLHGGLLHLGMNMWFLWIFGDNVEDRLGKPRFLFFYLLSGLTAGFAHALFSARSRLPTVGASGAISGVLGAYIVLFPAARIVALVPVFVFLTTMEIPAFIFLGFWFAIQFFSGMASLGMPKAVGGTAWFAHIGGFLSGVFLVKLLDRGSRRRNRRPISREDDLF